MAFLLQGLAFIILFLKAAMASLKKKKKHNDSLGSVTARFGLGEKTDPIRSAPSHVHSRVADDGGLVGRPRKYHR